MRRLRLLRGLVAAASAAAAVVACQLVAGIERVEKIEPSNQDEGFTPKPPDPCVHENPLPPPADDDDRMTVVPPVYLAFKSVALATPTTGVVGLDLDGVCTCHPDPLTDFDGGSSCEPYAPRKDCDGDGGIDNGAGAIFTDLSKAGGVPLDQAAQESIDRGLRTVLLNLNLWNGKPNDLEVEVGIIVSRGLVDPSGCGVVGPGPNHPPGWCGEDKWSFPRNTTVVDRGVRLPVLRGQGHVTKDRLVYRQSGPVTFFLGAVTVTFASPILQATISRTDQGRLRLEGVLAGRLAIDEMLGAIGQFEPNVVGPQEDAGDDAGPPLHVCTLPIYNALRQAACEAVDIHQSAVFDHAGGPCDALSIALRFVAEEATLGDVLDDELAITECHPSRVDAAVYQCPPRPPR